MTPEQATAELKYRLAKYIILSLRDNGMAEQKHAEAVIQELCKKYHPFTYELEVHALWPNE